MQAPLTSPLRPDWTPFRVSKVPQAPRSIKELSGIGDRLRAAAFAELQAIHAFTWAAKNFSEADPKLKASWLDLAEQEKSHLDALLQRMNELQIDPQERFVSDELWESLTTRNSAKDFAIYMANAERRGQRAGLRFQEALAQVDPISAALFGKIAQEEAQHIAIAESFFPKIL